MRPVVAVLLVAARAAADPLLTDQNNPHPGIHREVWTDTGLVIRLLRIDLSSRDLGLVATADPDRGQTVRAYAAQQGAIAAINGDAFTASGFVPVGLAIGMIGQVPTSWPGTIDDTTSAVFHFARVGERTSAAIEPAASVDSLATLGPATQGAISGRPMLVRAGVAATQLATDVTPRTALGITQDGNTLLMVVADGGIDLNSLAAFLRDRGAYDGVALDGGASSTLVLDDQVISDGAPQPVANQLAIRYQALPSGELHGMITGDAGVLAGAEVSLDDARMRTTGGDGEYDFTNVTQRIACVTVKATGYRTAYACTAGQIAPGVRNELPVQLVAGVDPIDAGATIDAPQAAGPTPPGGCCDASSGRPAIALLGVVAIFLTRRRGTTG